MELELTLRVAKYLKYALRLSAYGYYTRIDYYPFDLSKLDRVQFLNNLKTLIIMLILQSKYKAAKLTFCNSGRSPNCAVVARPTVSCTPSSSYSDTHRHGSEI